MRVVNIESLLDGESDENEVRKDFTASERVALKKAIEARIGDRQGERTDQLQEKSPEVPVGQQTRDYAAKKAGFDGEWTARQAELVVDMVAKELLRGAALPGRLAVPHAAGRATRARSACASVVGALGMSLGALALL